MALRLAHLYLPNDGCECLVEHKEHFNIIDHYMVILSACLATKKLLRDNVAIVIGAVVIAPLLGPNMGMAFPTTLCDAVLAKKSLSTKWRNKTVMQIFTDDPPYLTLTF